MMLRQKPESASATADSRAGFGMGRHIAVGEVAHPRFPGDGRQALHQAAVVVFAAAQFLFQGDAAGFPSSAAVDAITTASTDQQQ
jgi:hypothetical protein